MVWNETVEGTDVRLRAAQIGDAEFTYNIRQDKEKTRFIHSVNGTIDDQKEWLRSQREREGDYFFIVETKDDTPIGTTSVYNIQGDEGEGGRILLYGTPVQNAEATMLGYDFAFYVYGLKKLWLTVHEDNIHVQGYVKKFGAEEKFRKYSEEMDAVIIYYLVTEEKYQKKRQRIMKYIELLKQETLQ